MDIFGFKKIACLKRHEFSVILKTITLIFIYTKAIRETKRRHLKILIHLKAFVEIVENWV